MKKRMLDYNAYIQKKIEENSPNEDWEAVCKDYLIKIGFYQHERLVHLIVMVLFALMEVITVVAAVASGEITLLVLAAAVMVLLIPYIGHYYFLENEVQRMYDVYDKLCELAVAKK